MFEFLSKVGKVDELVVPVFIEFADCLVKRRKELGWSQDKLAEESGINRVTIAKLETYQRVAGIETVLKLLHTLGMKIQFEDIKKE